MKLSAARLCRLVDEGYTYEQIGSDLEVDPLDVRRLVEEHRAERTVPVKAPERRVDGRASKHLTDEQLRVYVGQGMTDAAIAAACGLSARAIRWRRKQIGLKRTERGRPYTVGVSNERIAELLGQGMSYAEVAKDLGVRHNLVVDRARKMGIRSSAVTQPAMEYDHEKLEALVALGASYVEIARQLGITYNVARKRAKQVEAQKKAS